MNFHPQFLFMRENVRNSPNNLNIFKIIIRNSQQNEKRATLNSFHVRETNNKIL